MSSATSSLQKAIFQKLSADAALTARIGAGGIVDRVIARRAFPCLVIGEIITSDWSTSTEPGEEHLVTLEIWSDKDGHADVQSLATQVRDLLHNQPLPLTGAVLVNLQHLVTRIRREPGSRAHVAMVQVRAVTDG
jgi:hypothetical protein